MKKAALLLACLLTFARTSAAPNDGKIHLDYWEKWSGEEENAMQQVVDAYNHSQDRVVVDFLSVGDIERKTILATAGGDPPDIAGIYLSNICQLADRDALMPLDEFIRAEGTTPEQFNGRYSNAFADLGTYHGHVFAVPSTPSTTAMFWNKDLFRAAGLDPEKPPRTLVELNEVSNRLLKRDASGNLAHVGFLPQACSGMVWSFPQWFGGSIFDGRDITIGNEPQNLAAFQWIADFTHQYGVSSLRHMTSSFGQLASAQDPFSSGQVAIIFDGVWRPLFIRQFSPGLKYGVAPWPSAQPGVNDFTIAESDLLVIPRGAKHPHEAWEFLRYISTPNLQAQRREDLSGVELLCLLQEKASPLKLWSPYFEANNPNHDLKVFRELAESQHVIMQPRMGIWEEYVREIASAFDVTRLDIATPQAALKDCQARMEDSWRWHRESLARRGQQTAATPP